MDLWQFKEMQRMQRARRDPEQFDKAAKRTRYVEMARQAARAGNLPDGWECATDPDSGNVYYFNKEKDIKPTWEAPIAEMVAILEERG